MAKQLLVKLNCKNLNLHFGRLHALKDVTFEVNDGEILSVIGPNGAGKTSLLNCINGFYRAQSGKIYFEGKEITHLAPHKIAKLGIARTFQNIELYTGLSVLDNLMAARHIHLRRGLLCAALFFGPTRREEIKHRESVEEIIDLLELEGLRKKVVASLSFGQRKRVDLARALCMEPKILLLDEPMAGMNVEEKEDMARFILDIYELKKTPIVLVEHDMEVVMDITSRCIVLDFGNKIAEGNPEEIGHNTRVIQAYLGEEEDASG